MLWCATGLLNQPADKPFLAQDHLPAGRFFVSLAEIGQKPPNGSPVKPVVGSRRPAPDKEVSSLELFGLAPINVVGFRTVVHNKSSASPSATSRNCSNAIFVYRWVEKGRRAPSNRR